jgi:hypothetical protein
MKTKTVGSVSEFLNGGLVHGVPEPFSVKVERHFKKYGFAYKVAGVAVILLASGGHALAAGTIDIEARKLYRELVNIGQWIIAFKGAIDIIRALGDGDVGSAKKTFISALLTFIILKSLPFGMDKVSQIFDKVTY